METRISILLHETLFVTGGWKHPAPIVSISWFQGIPLAMGTSCRKWTRVVRQEKVSPVTLTPLTRAKLTQNMVSAEYSRNWIQGVVSL